METEPKSYVKVEGNPFGTCSKVRIKVNLRMIGMMKSRLQLIFHLKLSKKKQQSLVEMRVKDQKKSNVRTILK